MTFDAPSSVAVNMDWAFTSDLPSAEPAASAVGDADIGATYAAIGEAMGRWQQLELALATLYARFRGYPGWLDKVRHFGASNPSFSARIDAIEAAATQYFAVHVEAADEADFRELCREAAFLSAGYARIAEGTVQDIASGSAAPRFVLQLPWYTHDRTRLADASALAAAGVREMSDGFLQLAKRVTALDQRCALFAH